MADDNNLDINIGINPAGAESGARRTSAAVSGVVRDTKDLDSAFRRLKSAIDPTFAAQEKYNKSVAEYDGLLKQGKINQQEYARYMDVLKRAYDSQVASIERNSSAARQAAADKKAIMLQEANDRIAAAQQEKAIADAWVAQEKKNTQALKAELAARTLAQKAAINEAAAAARAAAQATVANTRAGGTVVTKGAETAAIREAAAAAKQAARERVAAEKQADAEIIAAYAQSQEAAKALAKEAAATIIAAKQQQTVVEKELAESLTSVETAQRREATQAAREAAAAATSAAKARGASEKELAAGLRERQRAEEAAAMAAKKDAQALHEMRASIDPAFASLQRYNQTMRTATQLLMQNQLKTGEWTTIQKQAAIQMEINARQMGRMNQTGIQLGYQMQDVTASIASGINPLVIFAQQSGQVAFAMQGMGGMAGRVAGILGGIWFQAILGATIVLYKLWEANQAAEKATKDVMNAEDRRKMSVQELTAALREYTAAQREANDTTLQGKYADAQATMETQAKTISDMTKAKAELTTAEGRLDAAMKGTGMTAEAQAGAIAGATLQVFLAQRKVNGLQDQYKIAIAATTEAQLAQQQLLAGKSENEKRELMELQALTEGARRDMTAAAGNQNKIIEIGIRYQKEYAATVERYKKLKEEESKANKQQAKDEAQLYKSREDAIIRAGRALQGQGFKVTENFGIGSGKVGSHPGMGREAHGKYAIDINAGAGDIESRDPAIRAKMDTMVRQYQAAGFKVLWNGKVYKPNGSGPTYDIPAGQHQHKNHAHMEAPKSIVGQPAGMSLAKGIVSEAEQLQNEMIAAAKRAADELVETYDTAMQQIADDDALTNQEKLTQLLEFEQKRIAAVRDGYGEGSKQVEQAKQHELATIRRYNALILREEVQSIQRATAEKEAAERSSNTIGGTDSATRGDQVDFLASNKLISERQALVAKRAIMEEEYAAAQAHERRMLQIKIDGLRQELQLPNQSKARIDEINLQIENGQAEHYRKMAEMGAQYAQGVQRANQAAAQVTLNSWREVTDTFTSSLTQGLQGIWMKSQSVSGALLNMADQQVFKLMDMGVQMLNNWVMKELGMTAASQAGNAARSTAAATAAATEQGVITATQMAATTAEAIKTGAAVQGAAAQTGVAATAGVSEITTNAGVAAAGAYKSTVVIPFIGPVAAPAAAALALAAVLGFASLISAEGGMGEVPSDQLAMVHKKEMILPAWIAEPMRQSLASPGSSTMMMGANMAGQAARTAASTYGDSFEFNYRPSHTNMGASMDTLLRQDGATMRKWLKNEIRNGNLKVPR